ncbi:MAG TPA: type II secretion system F family protein [Armatimonadota bacterium]|jgi:tight adherence protein B
MDKTLTILIFLLACGTFYALITAFMRKEPAQRQGLEALKGPSGSPEAFVEGASSRREALGRASRQWRRFDQYRSLEQTLERAGWNLTPVEFLIVAFIVAVVCAVGVAWWQHSVLWGGLSAVMVGIVAMVALEYARIRRMARFEAALPEALELMAASLRSGQGFQRALQVTAEDMPSPVKEEFGMAVQDITIGHTVEEALQSIWRRVPSYEMELITTAIGIQLQVGGNLSEILQKIADTLRERARIRGEIATLTAEGKLSAVMVFAIPILLFFWMKSANPTYMAPLLNTDIGRMMLLMAAISECVGMIIIWKMVSMEV